MNSYHIYGRPFAGSLIVEFLLRLSKIDYTIEFPDEEERSALEFLKRNPTGRIPVLICPDGEVIYESLAIIHYLTSLNPDLAPQKGDSDYRHYLSVITLLACNMYPAMHRQHHSYQYGPESAFDEIKAMAEQQNQKIFSYLETIIMPYIGGNAPNAADFYFYMMTRWQPDKEAMITGRPKLNSLIQNMRAHPIVEATFAAQPKKKK